MVRAAAVDTPSPSGAARANTPSAAVAVNGNADAPNTPGDVDVQVEQASLTSESDNSSVDVDASGTDGERAERISLIGEPTATSRNASDVIDRTPSKPLRSQSKESQQARDSKSKVRRQSSKQSQQQQQAQAGASEATKLSPTLLEGDDADDVGEIPDENENDDENDDDDGDDDVESVPEIRDEYLLLCTDGVWEFIGSQECVDLCTGWLEKPKAKEPNGNAQKKEHVFRIRPKDKETGYETDGVGYHADRDTDVEDNGALPPNSPLSSRTSPNTNTTAGRGTTGDVRACAEQLCKESWDRWSHYMKGQVVDDITAMVVLLR